MRAGGKLQVLGVSIHTDAITVFESAFQDRVTVGSYIEAEGTLLGDSAILAHEVDIVAQQDNGGGGAGDGEEKLLYRVYSEGGLGG